MHKLIHVVDSNVNHWFWPKLRSEGLNTIGYVDGKESITLFNRKRLEGIPEERVIITKDIDVVVRMVEIFQWGGI